MDILHKEVLQLVERDTLADEDPAATFFRVLELAHGREPADAVCLLPSDRVRTARLTETWFC